MYDDLQLVPMQTREAAMQEIRSCTPVCERYGLSLSEADVRELAEARERALADTGRVEFEGGILPKLMRAFCDSPYVRNESWAETLAGLQEAFYYFKGDAEERFSDDELIDFMSRVFNGRAQGSAEYLSGTSLEALCRYARQGWDARAAEDLGDVF